MSKKLTELQKRKEALEAEQKAERAKLAAKLSQEKKRLSKIEHAADTRRKVLAGAAVLEWATKDSEFGGRLHKELDAFLVRPAERALFGLAVSDKQQKRANGA